MKIIPLAQKFRIYCEKPTGLVKPQRGVRRYFTVFLFRDKPTMYKFFDLQNERMGLPALKKDFSAITRVWKHLVVDAHGHSRIGSSLGAILLHRDWIGAGTISHEMTHAVIGWAAIRGLDPSRVIESMNGHRDANRTEEMVCWVQGYLVNQFWNKFYRLTGVVEPGVKHGKE